MRSLLNKQLQSSIKLDLSIMPTDAFSLRGDAFYSLVEELTSKDIEDLFRIQKISNARCFLNTNSLAFFDISSDDPFVIQLQDRLSIKVLNSKRAVLAGVHGYVHYLQELFNLFLMKKKNKRTKSNNSTTVRNLLHQVPSTPMSTTPLSVDSSTANASSKTNHHDYLNEKIKFWWEMNRDQFKLENYALTEPNDYEIIINDKSAFVKCCYNKRINIPMVIGRKYYQLSNFYKHLTENSQCTAIERMRPKTGSDNDDDLDVSSSPSSSSNPSDPRHTETTTEDSRQSMELDNNSSQSISKHKRRRT
jgi:hypothetical protein